MAQHAHAASHASHEHAAHAHPNYVKIWGILCALLAVSVAGPFFGHPWVTLITAFGIAGVKAYLVAKNFMHINVEKPFVAYIVATVLVFVFLFFAGTAPDVMKKEGTQWEKPSWKVPAQPAAGHEGAHH
jgi:caa(3)-type oxidase subunit IV